MEDGGEKTLSHSRGVATCNCAAVYNVCTCGFVYKHMHRIPNYFCLSYGEFVNLPV